MLLVPPGAAYSGYINAEVLCLLFCFMLVQVGMQTMLISSRITTSSTLKSTAVITSFADHLVFVFILLSSSNIFIVGNR